MALERLVRPKSGGLDDGGPLHRLSSTFPPSAYVPGAYRICFLRLGVCKGSDTLGKGGDVWERCSGIGR